MTKETEEQRLGRNKQTSVNHSYIKSGEYRKKFDAISDNMELSRLLYNITKEMLFHRAGTKYSDVTKKIIHNYDNILTIHTHPDSFPPSIEDINSNYDHSYVAGIIACHDGM